MLCCCYAVHSLNLNSKSSTVSYRLDLTVGNAIEAHCKTVPTFNSFSFLAIVSLSTDKCINSRHTVADCLRSVPCKSLRHEQHNNIGKCDHDLTHTILCSGSRSQFSIYRTLTIHSRPRLKKVESAKTFAIALARATLLSNSTWLRWKENWKLLLYIEW